MPRFRVRLPAVLREPALVFGVALGVRLLYLWESSASPGFAIPVLDEELYHELATSLSASGRVTEAFFFQAPFYPTFLAALYAVVGPSTLAAKLLQSLVDAGTCWLTARLATRLFERRVGTLAGLVSACYAPQFFYAGQLVGTSWACFFGVGLLLALDGAQREPTLGRVFLVGLSGALAALTHPLFIPVALGGGAYLLVRTYRHPTARARLPALALAWSLGCAVLFAPALGQSTSETPAFAALPTSGGLNVYLGNNPNRCETLQIRGGQRWQRLLEQPFKEDRTLERSDANVSSHYFARTFEFLELDPLAFLQGLAFKAAQLLQSQEIPRSFDIYVARNWSRLLQLFVWKWGPFGFPFGLLLPLAAYGAVALRRRVPTYFWLFLGLYAAATISVFVASRYRAPLLPPLIILAAAGAWHLGNALGSRVNLGSRVKKPSAKTPARAAWYAAAATSAVSLLPTIKCETATNFEAELYQLVGTRHLDSGRFEQAAHYLNEAVRLAPGYGEAHYNLGLLQAKQGDDAAALENFERTLEIYPDYGAALKARGVILLKQGQYELAHATLVAATQRGGANADDLADIGGRLLKSGKQAALRFLMSGVQQGTTRVEAYVTLGAVARERGEVASAYRIYEKGIETHPDFADFYFALAEMHATDGHVQRAREVLERLRSRGSRDPRLEPALERYTTAPRPN